MNVNSQDIKRILAIETSCDETAAAVVEKNGKNIRILSNVVSSQIDLHKKFGGVFPEIASRAHSEKIIPVVEKALRQGNNYTLNAIRYTLFDTIAVTTGPGLIGSLLIGVNFAKTLAYTTKKPIIGINHWLGHIYSNFVRNPKSKAQNPKFPALILIVSGGHTGLVLMKSHDDIVPLGETLDDAAGEAFDKVAKLLDLGYPGGPVISQAAKDGDNLRFAFPRSMLDRKDHNFSFSGLKTAVLYQVNELTKRYTLNAIRCDIAASFQQAVIDILVGKTIQAAYEFHPKSICLCGGVSANKELREQLKKEVSHLPWKCSYHIPPMELTTDNAAMIGIAAAYHLDKKTTFDKINADANLKL